MRLVKIIFRFASFLSVLIYPYHYALGSSGITQVRSNIWQTLHNSFDFDTDQLTDVSDESSESSFFGQHVIYCGTTIFDLSEEDSFLNILWHWDRTFFRDAHASSRDVKDRLTPEEQSQFSKIASETYANAQNDQIGNTATGREVLTAIDTTKKVLEGNQFTVPDDEKAPPAIEWADPAITLSEKDAKDLEARDDRIFGLYVPAAPKPAIQSHSVLINPFVRGGTETGDKFSAAEVFAIILHESGGHAQHVKPVAGLSARKKKLVISGPESEAKSYLLELVGLYYTPKWAQKPAVEDPFRNEQRKKRLEVAKQIVLKLKAGDEEGAKKLALAQDPRGKERVKKNPQATFAELVKDPWKPEDNPSGPKSPALTAQQSVGRVGPTPPRPGQLPTTPPALPPGSGRPPLALAPGQRPKFPGGPGDQGTVRDPRKALQPPGPGEEDLSDEPFFLPNRPLARKPGQQSSQPSGSTTSGGSGSGSSGFGSSNPASGDVGRPDSRERPQEKASNPQGGGGGGAGSATPPTASGPPAEGGDDEGNRGVARGDIYTRDTEFGPLGRERDKPQNESPKEEKPSEEKPSEKPAGGDQPEGYQNPDAPTAAQRRQWAWLNSVMTWVQKGVTQPQAGTTSSAKGDNVRRPTEEGPMTYSGNARSGNVVVDPANPDAGYGGSTRSPNAPPSGSQVTPQNVGTPIEQGMGHVYDVSDVRGSRCADGFGGPQCNEFRGTPNDNAAPSGSNPKARPSAHLSSLHCVPPGVCQFGMVKDDRTISQYACLAPPEECRIGSGATDTGVRYCNDENRQIALRAFRSNVTVLPLDSGGSLCSEKSEANLCPGGFHFQGCWLANNNFGYLCQTNEDAVVCADR